VLVDPVEGWLEALARRHLAELTFAEVRRGLQALSSLYVERRGRLATGAALDGAGKRAAFALYYGPLHFLLVRDVVRALGPAASPASRILDLGCGTGVAGAAWALEHGGRAVVDGVDQSGWAVAEARWTLAQLGLRGGARRGDLARADPPAGRSAVVMAFTANELADGDRGQLWTRLRAAAARGTRVLILEPLARRIAPWWDDWRGDALTAGGRADEWRFPGALPEAVAKLARAAGLDPRERTARSLFLGGPIPS
jgi:methyltransferase family protein